MADMRKKDSKALIKRVRKRFKVMVEADEENRRDAREDIRFVNMPGAQWDENMKKLRGNDRPCYEFNKTRIRCKRVINDMRDNRPSGKVRAVEGGDKEIAEIYEGLIRNILNVSHADNATDYAAEYQVEGGMGAWRIVTDYADDSSFNQDIKIESLENPFCLYCDPAAKDSMKRDAEDWILTERISHALYEERYGKEAEKVDFEGDGEFEDDQNDDEWLDETTVRIAEYWYRVPHTKDLWLIDGVNAESGEPEVKTVDSESDEAQALLKQGFKPTRTRTVKTKKIMMCIASGSRILEGPTEWPSRFFPFIMVYGEMKVIDGKRYWWGLPRFARDPQQDYNVARTAISEAIAGAPKEFFWATVKQAEGHVEQWATAHYENLPWKIYNPDEKAPGAPSRVGGADVPVALMQQAAIADQELNDVMGVPDASLGNQGDEKSGRAIYARQQQGQIATFNFKDNMAKAYEYTYEILIDMIPNIYDTERELRILGADGAEDYRRVNQVVIDPDTGKEVRVNDLSAGKYDVTITVGPAFSTLRQEAAETYGELGQRFPALMELAGDLVFKSMDLPYADEIGDRLRAMLPPQIQKMLNEDTPPEIQQMMMQVEQAMGEVQKHGQLVQAAEAELNEQKAGLEKEKAEIKTELANVRAAKAEFDAHVAEEMAKFAEVKANMIAADAKITSKSADLTKKGVELYVQEQAMGEGDKLKQTVASIDSAVVTYMQQATESMQRIMESMQKMDQKVNRKVTNLATRREGGKLFADVEYDDGTRRTQGFVRDKGNLKLVPDSGDTEA